MRTMHIRRQTMCVDNVSLIIATLLRVSLDHAMCRGHILDTLKDVQDDTQC